MRPIAFVLLSCLPVAAFAQQPVASPVYPSPTRTNLPSTPSAYTSVTLNYVRTWEPSKPITDPALVITSSSVTDVKQATQYLDGLGRPLQTVSKGISPNNKDMVTPIRYDAYGREQYKYLPYVDGGTADGSFRMSPFADQAAFISAQYSGDQVGYGETVFEASPLNRVLNTMAPGNSWTGSGKGVGAQYLVNTAFEDVRIWNIAVAAGSVPTSSGAYPTGELYKNITTDEAGHQVVEYKNKQGQVILKKIQLATTPGADHTGWLCTYYVYDDLNNLRFVISPKAVESINGSWSVSNTVSDELCFRYEYDGRNRMIVKKVPGAAEVLMVYDVRDRLVLTQDGNLRAAGKWMAVLYDELNRPVMTGFYNSAASHATLQGQFGGVTSQQMISHDLAAVLHISAHDGRAEYRAKTEIVFEDGFDTHNTETETFLDPNATPVTQTVIANTIASLSASDIDPLTYTYYDDYSFPGSKAAQSSYFTKPQAGTNPYSEAIVTSSQTKGATTGTKVKVMATNQWLVTTTYYDDKGRAVQLLSDNINGGVDIITNMYDFSGKLLSSYQYQSNLHSTATPNTRVLTMNTYDHAGRIVKVTKQLNDDVNLQRDIAVNTYNVSGQLQEKIMKKAGGVDLESLEYAYNIRGWLSGINKDYVNTSNGGHYFGQELNYDYGFNGTPQLNGNIAGIKWKGFNNTTARAYGYTYDNSNRLLKANFTELNGTWGPNANVNFNVLMGNDGTDATTAYDANGNIKRMQQWGIKGGSSPQIDDISYSYNDYSNKLKATTDAANDASSTLGDFKEATSGGMTDYTYDVNGNLTKDENKQISGIGYNHLNLPQQITVTGKGSIQYVYDAAGVKLRKIVTDNTVSPSMVTTTDYVAGIIYENDQLQFISHEEGRIRAKAGSSPVEYVYDYFVKDHLGNIRMVLTEETSQNLYMASMEPESAAKENALFSNVDASRANRPTGYPKEQRIAPKNDYVAKLNGNDPDKRVGPSIVLKVMAGDTIAISTRAFYKSQAPQERKQKLAPVADMATAVSLAFGGQNSSTPGHGGNAASRSPLNQQFFNNDYDRLKDKDPGKDPSGQRPRAYLNYALFDEQFKLVEDNSGVRQVQAQPDQVQTLAQGKMVAQQSGFLYVYTSNETPQDVFFDELMVVTNPGAVLEETHYYPFGLTMSGISSRAIYNPENRYKYNGIELNSDFDLYSYEALYRNLDPQIGRWWQIDPKPDVSMSPYISMANNPMLNTDPLGDTIIIIYMNGFLPAMATYNNGKLRQADGNPVSNDQTGYGTKVFKDLQRLDNLGDKEISNRIDAMEQSENNHYVTIPQPGKGNANRPDSQDKDDNNIPTGSTTFYDPNNTISPTGEKRDPIIGLAHELLGHGYDTDRGKSSQKKTTNGISMNEVSGVNIENRVRAKVGAPQKTTYGGVSIPASLLNSTYKKRTK